MLLCRHRSYSQAEVLLSLSRLAIKIAGLFLATYAEAMINCRGMKK